MTFAKFWERVQNFVPGTAPDLEMPDNKVEDFDWDQYLRNARGISFIPTLWREETKT